MVLQGGITSVEAWNMARTLRLQVQASLIRAKKSYIADQIKRADGDSSAFWQNIKKSFLDEADVGIDQMLNSETGEILEGKDASNYLNEYFCRISETLSEGGL